MIADGFLGGEVSSRFSYSVFIDDALFQPLPDLESAAEFRGYEVGSVIVSAAVAGIDRVSDLSKPVRMRFQIRQVHMHECICHRKHHGFLYLYKGSAREGKDSTLRVLGYRKGW